MDARVMSHVLESIERDIVPGGSKENAELHAQFTTFSANVRQPFRLALSDAQTSGGLLISLPILCAVIGEVREGEGITVS